jgi:hypothetical protein
MANKGVQATLCSAPDARRWADVQILGILKVHLDYANGEY